MTHPCKSNPDTITMHACSTVTSAKTLCGLDVDPTQIGVVSGYTQVCPDCFPLEEPQKSQENLPFR
jgi:hypothetical protein